MVNRYDSSQRTLRRASVLLALALAFAPVAARADARSDAKLAYNEAEAEYNLGNFDKALESFEQAYKLARVPAILFNIAQCHRQLNNLDRAASTYRSFIRLDPNNGAVPQARELLAQVEAALKAQQTAAKAAPLEQAPAKLTAPSDESVPLTQAERNALASKQSASVPPPPMEAPKLPKSAPQTVASTSSSPPPQTRPAAATGSTAPAGAVSAGPAPEVKPSHTFTWVAAAGAVVGLGAGTVFALKSKSTASELSGSEHDRATANTLQSDLKSQATTANVLLIAGGALALGAVVLFLVGK